MPTYTYKCKKCQHEMDVFHAISAEPHVKCEACGSTKMDRLIGTGSGIIFKGSGFYETDYKKDGGKGAKKSAKPETGRETKSESKPEPKPDSGTKSDTGNTTNSTSAA